MRASQGTRYNADFNFYIKYTCTVSRISTSSMGMGMMPGSPGGSSSNNITYKLGTSYKLTIPTFSQYPNCSNPFTYEFRYLGAAVSWIKKSGSYYYISTTDTRMSGKKSVQLIVRNGTAVYSSYYFHITFSCATTSVRFSSYLSRSYKYTTIYYKLFVSGNYYLPALPVYSMSPNCGRSLSYSFNQSWIKKASTTTLNPPESSRTYSSIYNNAKPGSGNCSRSALDSTGAWCSKYNSYGSWM